MRRPPAAAAPAVVAPLTDAELRELLAPQKRPEVARLNRAPGLGYAASAQESL